MTEVLAFNRWDTKGIKVMDAGLERYVTLDARIVPKTGARYAGNKFHKSKVFIVERLINKVMVPGHKGKKHFRTSSKITGKAHTAYSIVEEAFKIVEKETKRNPIEVFVRALENAAPREEIVSVEYGGARYPKATECAPQRRVDMALRYMTQGAYHRSFNAKKGMVKCLAEEIINAFNLSLASNAIAKKSELERQADASR
ncbi:30S ribosomal protein S7 [Candidatus Woesearchaeota archaeon]|nr:30S ribosomal protein S7 [Candidatus Woesearchaeota archaeon]